MLISFLVKPGSSLGPKLVKTADREYIAYLRERPHDGEANAALIKLLAKTFHVPKTSISIKSGSTSRKKLISLPDQCSA